MSAKVSSTIRLADEINALIKAEAARHKALPEEKLSPGELKGRKKAFTDAQTNLFTASATVSAILNTMKRTRDAQAARAAKRAASDSKRRFRSPVALAAVATPAAAADPSPVDSLKDSFLSGLSGPAATLQDMATKIEPIMGHFESLGKLPYLDSFNAALDIAPLIGIKDNAVVYLQTTTSGQQWSSFSPLPADAPKITNQQVFLFPFMGAIYLSIGTAVWIKPSRSQGDPGLVSALDNFPQMYLKEWQKIGDAVLPNNITGISQLISVTSDGKTASVNLVTLDSDGKLAYFTGESLKASGNTWTTLNFTSADGKQIAPKFKQLGYSSGYIYGHDGAKIWKVVVKFDLNTWAANPDDADNEVPVRELSGDEKGLAAIRDDNFLYHRMVDISDPEKPKFEWTKNISAEGISHLGVTAPGAFLNLRIVTSYLQSRYLETQTALYPLVESYNAFGVSHKYYLTELLGSAQKWQAAGDDEKKQEEAIKEGQAYFNHVKTWSRVISGGAAAASVKVVAMNNQLTQIHNQILQQLSVLNDKLAGLQVLLGEQEKVYEKFKAAFWASVGVMFLGIIIAIVGLALELTGPWATLVIGGGGVLFAAGFIGMITFGVLMGKAAEAVSATKSQIDSVQSSINHLTEIDTHYGSLEDEYQSLNQFWGRVVNDLNTIKTLDRVTALNLGQKILSDTGTIKASIDKSDDIAQGTQKYLDILNKFITPPSDDAPAPAAARFLSRRAIAPRHEVKAIPRPLPIVAEPASIPGAQDWFSVGALRGTATIWGTTSFVSLTNKNLVTDMGSAGTVAAFQVLATKNAAPLDTQLALIKPKVLDSLQAVIDLTSILVVWQKQFPDSKSAQTDPSKVASLRDKSLSACDKARKQAKAAADAFIDFNNSTTEYSHKIESKKGELQTIIAAADRILKDRLSASPPWYVHLGALGGLLGEGISVAAWEASNRSGAYSDYHSRVDPINEQIKALDSALQSGIQYNGNWMTWETMVKTVSELLGHTYNQLAALKGQVLEDPVFYKSLIGQEWGTIQRDASDVKAILQQASSGPVIVSLARLRAAPREVKGEVKGEDKGLDAQALGQAVSNLADGTVSTLNSIKSARLSPDSFDLVAYWTSDKKTRVTVSQAADIVKAEYLASLRNFYNPVQNMSSFAIVEDYRAKSLSDATAAKFLSDTSSGLASLVAEFEGAQPSQSVASFARDLKNTATAVSIRINQLSDQVNKMSAGDFKNLEEKVMEQFADIITGLIADGPYALKLGFPSKIANALTSLLNSDADFATISAAVAGALMEVKKISTVKSMIAGLQKAVTSLNQAVENFGLAATAEQKSGKGWESSGEEIARLQLTATQYLANKTPFSYKGLDKGWTVASTACSAWLDVVNAQGIIGSR